MVWNYRCETAENFLALAEEIREIARDKTGSVKGKFEYSLPRSLRLISDFHDGDVKCMILDAAFVMQESGNEDNFDWWLERLAVNCKEFAREIMSERISVFVIPPLV
ncbi:hypothetical protein IJJ27_03485 [bacterium]|nr:hypothetical protein [bacterium]